MYDTSPYSSSFDSSDNILSLDFELALGFIFFIIIALILYVVFALFLGKVFKKAGVESWKAWVPVLNNWKLLEIGGQQGFWSLLVFLPVGNFVSVIFTIIAMYNINRKMGYDIDMTVLAVLLPLVWVIILATSKTQWNDSLGAPRVDRPDIAMPHPVGPQPYPTQDPPANVQPQYAPYGPPPAANNAPTHNPQPQQSSGFQQTVPQPAASPASESTQPTYPTQQPVAPAPYQSPQQPEPATNQPSAAQPDQATESVLADKKPLEGPSVDLQQTTESTDQQSTK